MNGRGRTWIHGGLVVAALALVGCGGPEPAPEPEPVAGGPGRDVPELGRPRPKLLPTEASASAGRE